MIEVDFWKAHYQILSIIFLKEFIKLNVNKDTMIKNVKLVEVCNCFLGYTNFKDDLIEYKYLYYNKNCQQKLNEKLKEQFLST